MSVYRRGKIWWFRFKFAGQKIRESSKSTSKTVAQDAQRSRRRELERGYNGIDKSQRAQLFSVAAEGWLEAKEGTPLAAQRINRETEPQAPQAGLRRNAAL